MNRLLRACGKWQCRTPRKTGLLQLVELAGRVLALLENAMNTHFGFAYLITNHVAASDFGTEVIWKTSIPKTHGGKDGYHGNCIIENTLVVGRLFCPPFLS